jgi:hypothetical protein
MLVAESHYLTAYIPRYPVDLNWFVQEGTILTAEDVFIGFWKKKTNKQKFTMASLILRSYTQCGFKFGDGIKI